MCSLGDLSTAASFAGGMLSDQCAPTRSDRALLCPPRPDRSRASRACDFLGSLANPGVLAGGCHVCRLDAARSQACEAAERVRLQAEQAAGQAAVQAERVRLQAEQAAAQARDRAKETAAWATDIGGRGAGGLRSPGGGGGAQAPASRLEKVEDGSDSGGDEGSWASAPRLGGLVGVAARFGLGGAAGSNPEVRPLVPKSGSDLEAGGVGSGSAGAAAFVGDAASRLSALGKFGQAGLSSLSGSAQSLGTGLGQGLGLVETPKEHATGIARLFVCCPTLTKAQRMLGFVVCFSFGALLSLSALSSLPSLLIGNPAPFAFKYTFGNLLSLASSSFLVGPAKQVFPRPGCTFLPLALPRARAHARTHPPSSRPSIPHCGGGPPAHALPADARAQCRDMLAPERRTASLIYVGALGGTLSSVFGESLAPRDPRHRDTGPSPCALPNDARSPPRVLPGRH